MKLKKLSRREVIAGLAMTGAYGIAKTPIDMFVKTMLNGIIDRADADTNGGSNINFLHITTPGAISRWTWDLFLAPNDGDLANLIPNTMVGNQLNLKPDGTVPPAGQGAISYKTVKINGVNVPLMWTTMLPTPSGSLRPMSDLLANALSIRGVDMQEDGHINNNSRQMAPLAGGASLTGLLADASGLPIPAMSYGSAGAIDAFASQKGSGQTQLFGTNPLQAIMVPFQGVTTNTNPIYSGSSALALNTAVDSTLTKFAAHAATLNPRSARVFTDYTKAENLIKNYSSEFGNFANDYTALYNKYAALITAAFRTPVAGITDKPITGSGTDLQFSIVVGNKTGMIGGENIQQYFGVDANGAPTTMPTLAGGFAVAEYCLLKGLSQTMVIGSDVIPVNFPTFYSTPTQGSLVGVSTTPDTSKTIGQLSVDQHFSGAVTSMIVGSMYFSALSACLLELTSQLKSANLFNQTVINYSNEFNRVPRMLAYGSDHGFNGSGNFIMSGMINGLIPMGNIYRQDPLKVGTPFLGTWGAGANVVGISNQTMKIGHVTSTIATMLGVSPIMVNDIPLVSVQGGKVQSVIEKPTLV